MLDDSRVFTHSRSTWAVETRISEHVSLVQFMAVAKEKELHHKYAEEQPVYEAYGPGRGMGTAHVMPPSSCIDSVQ